MKRWLFAALCLPLVGCAGAVQEERYSATLTGTVTLDGKPLEMGMIVFMTEDGSGSGIATIRQDGSFTSDGKLPWGKLKAGVKTSHLAGLAKAAAAARSSTAKGGPPIAMPPGTFRPVPPQYEDPSKSGLTFELNKGANAPVKLELKSA